MKVVKLMENNKEIKVVLVDDHQLFREGLKRIINLEKDMEVIAEFADGKQIIENYGSLNPDLILMDINMPEVNGVDATKQLNKLYPGAKVIILSIHDDEGYVFKALKLGAVGYLLKDMDAKTLVDAIRAVYSGNKYIHYEITGSVIKEYCRLSKVEEEVANLSSNSNDFIIDKYEDTNNIQNLLTSREIEVLQLMAEGNSNRVIGEKLFISEKTVKNHVSSILQKLNVQDRTQAVIQSIKSGWIHL